MLSLLLCSGKIDTATPFKSPRLNRQQMLRTLASSISLLLFTLAALLWLIPFFTEVGPLTCGNPTTTAFELSAFRGSPNPTARMFHYTGYIRIARQHGYAPENRFNADLWNFTSHSIFPGVSANHLTGPWRFGDKDLIGHQDWLIIHSAYLVIAVLPLAIAGSLAPVRALRRRLRTHRGRCPICDYNLTANTTGICPECGSKIVRHKDLKA